MTVNPGRVTALYDAEASATLRSSTSAITSTTTDTAISLNELDTAFWHDGNEIPYGLMEISIAVTALDLTTGDETYTIEVLVDDTSDMSNTPRTVATLAVRAVGFYKVFVDSKNIPLLDSDTSGADKWMAIKATLAGTTPSLTYNAWLSKSGC